MILDQLLTCDYINRDPWQENEPLAQSFRVKPTGENFISPASHEPLSVVNLPTQYQAYIHLSRYSRWIESENRRESWSETVKRYCDFWQKRFDSTFPYDDIYKAISELKVMPSMRALMTAGKALEIDELAGYNCSYVAIDHIRAFDEILYILMCGTGVGFSVESHSIAKLPKLPDVIVDSPIVIHVEDSKIGWADAFRELLEFLWMGRAPKWDVSRVRPAGARLKTFGGRASGPAPLVRLFEYTVQLFKAASGRQLSSLECHDLVCLIADIVVVGGVRRSALISLSDLSDEKLRVAKSGPWWEKNGHRALANNSAVYNGRPSYEQFSQEWDALRASHSGERGIFNRLSAIAQVLQTNRRDPHHDFGLNPCAEVILRSMGLCNLTEVVVRYYDTLSSLKKKVEQAVILGKFQSTLTNFRYVRDQWRINQEQERLLGVSLTGIMDHPVLSTNSPEARQILSELKAHAIQTDEVWSLKLNIPVAAGISLVKPSGTVSQLVNSSSGIHARYAKKYLRTTRADVKDPLAIMMQHFGVMHEPEKDKPSSVVFTFAVQAPANSKTRHDFTAIEQLEHYLMVRQSWCEHNPSITVNVRESEWDAVKAWVWEHLDDVCGISFLDYDDNVYDQAPYQDCTDEQFNQVASSTPDLDWTKLSQFEHEDSTDSVKELACVAGLCAI